MASYLEMASKINMGSMSHTSLMSYVKIWESKTQTDDPIEVPCEKDGTLLLSTLIGQYPNTAGLRFWSDTGAWRGLKCEDNVIYPPPEGWGTRDYYIVAGPPNLKRSAEEEDGPTSKAQRTEEELEEDEEEEDPEIEEPEDEEGEEEEMVEESVEIKKEPEEEKVPEFILQALPYTMTDEELKEHLQKFGELESCQIIKNKRSGGSRGYAFLRYKTNEGAKKAQEGIHIFNGRRYYLQRAKPKNTMGEKMHMHSNTRIKLFVGHLPAGADESHLRDYFSKYGVLKDVYVPKPNKGYGFIEFGSQEIADKVLSDTHILMDTFLNVNYPTSLKQSDVKRAAEKMAKGQGNGRPGILGYYGVGPMGMSNDMPVNYFNGPNNYRDPYRDPFRDPRNNFNFNSNNLDNRNNFNFNNNFDNRNNFNFNNNFDNMNNSDNRNNFNIRGNFRGRGGGRGGLPRPPWAN